MSLILCHTCPPGPPAICHTRPWLDAHGCGALETQKLAAAFECWCVSQPSSWRTCAQHPARPSCRMKTATTCQHEELGRKISQVRFSRQRCCAEERDQLPDAKWGTSTNPGKKVLFGSNDIETVWAPALGPPQMFKPGWRGARMSRSSENGEQWEKAGVIC